MHICLHLFSFHSEPAAAHIKMDEGNSAQSVDAKAAGKMGRARARAGTDEHVRANVGKDDRKACNGAYRRSRSVGCRSPAIQGDRTKDDWHKDSGARTRRMRGAKVGVGGRADAITSNLVQHPPTASATHRESTSPALRRWKMLARSLSTHQVKSLSVGVFLRLTPSLALLSSIHNSLHST